MSYFDGKPYANAGDVKDDLVRIVKESVYTEVGENNGVFIVNQINLETVGTFSGETVEAWNNKLNEFYDVYNKFMPSEMEETKQLRLNILK